jgi:hypothetical protein
VDPDTDPKGTVKSVPQNQKRCFSRSNLRTWTQPLPKALMKEELAPALFKVSKCPDLITDRGHYYGTKLSDSDKRALIEFLKTL